MTDVATNFPPENLSLTFYLQGSADQVKSTHVILFIILVSCKGDITCPGNTNSKIRVFSTISDYHFNTVSFNPFRNDFQGNYVGFKPGNMEILEKNIFNTFESQYIIKMCLHHQNITKLDPGAFLFLDCLKTLDLHANKIKLLSEAVFLNLDRIEELDLSENKLQEIPPLTFNQTRTLKSLNLSNNKLERLSKNSFFQLNNLEKLNLSYNALSNIDVTTFDYLVSLKILLLNGNKLTRISPDKWFSLFNLRVLDLSDNLLVNLDSGYQFSFGFTLRYLNLTGNRLTKLNILGLLVNVPSLSFLGIESNWWQCSKLELMVNILRTTKVSYKGTVRNGTQIDGITCYNGTDYEYSLTSSADKGPIDEKKNNVDSHLKGVTHHAQIMMSIILCLLIIVVVILFLEVLVRCNLRDVLGIRRNRTVLNNSNVEHIALISR